MRDFSDRLRSALGAGFAFSVRIVADDVVRTYRGDPCATSSARRMAMRDVIDDLGEWVCVEIVKHDTMVRFVPHEDKAGEFEDFATYCVLIITDQEEAV